ncbi:MAG: (4Fe-4S)-binding protein [Taibaiella sp.]|nr:(4Fe-4S)-binding protein [Taibaiella sp.]
MEYKFEKAIHGTIGNEKYTCTMQWRNGTFIADEPKKSGGKDRGPDPYTLLLSSLASCTLITLRMYIDRKEWDIKEITVNANMYQETRNEELVTIIDRDIRTEDKITEEQRKRLVEIARACPISRLLEGKTEVRTFIYDEGQEAKQLYYGNGEISVKWKPELCRHAARCVGQLPQVFNSKAKPWVDAHAATTQQIIEQVGRCPSGALGIRYDNLQVKPGIE